MGGPVLLRAATRKEYQKMSVFGGGGLWRLLSVAVVALLVCTIGASADQKPTATPSQLSPDWASAADPVANLAERSAEVSEAVRQAESADHEITRARAEGRVSVLVYMDPNLGRQALKRSDVRRLANRLGGKVQYEYRSVLPNVLNLRNIPESRLDALKNMPGVARVEIDEYHPNVVKLHDSTPLIRGLQSQITGAGLSADGSGVRVCVCDTGIDSDHIMYSSRIDTAAGRDFYNDDNDPEDDNGHGTHCSGIAVGGTGISWDPCGTGSEPFQGVAPAATLIGVKILNQFGGGYDSDIIAGIDYCADQTASGGRADVISLSIGTGQYSGLCSHSWAVAANNAVANGVVVVAASGNENYSNAMASPACGVDVIAVGATYKADYPTCEDNSSSFNWSNCTDSAPVVEDQVVCFSNESDYLDVTAPGAVIWSASNSAGGSSIVGMSGTSMACPHVAGLAALVLDADPTLTPAQVRQVIRDGAIDFGPAGFDRGYGYGRIDVINTLNQLTPCTGDEDCDDGLFCNGSETCVDQSCMPGTDPCAGAPCDEATDTCSALQYEWTLDTNPGWTMEGQWAYGQPTGGGGQYGGPDPTSGATGSNVLGYNLAGDYANNLPETHLTSTAIDCSGLTNVTLSFQRWLGVEQPAYDHAYIRVSNNGSTWTTIWQNSAEVADSSWTLQEYDISAVADNQSTVYLRWTMGTTDTSWQYCGWNIDDIQIWATGGGPECTIPADCDDGLWCNGAEDCVSGSCVAGTPPNCNDGVGCTDDYCNESTDSCDNIVNDANCDNGQWCDGAETCHATLDCQTGTAPDCNDGVACTDDSCNESTDSCDNVANDANCDNGLWCDGAETCHATLDCQAGTAPNCDDGVTCTDDTCNETTDSCDNIANDANCADGLFCNGAETCDPVFDCQAGSDPCPGQLCDEVNDVCIDCSGDPDCDDGLYCNGAETCVGGTCQPGTAVDCNDGVSCTDDSCNETTDSCDNVANDANCPDNGLFCDGAEYCDAVNDCSSTGDPCLAGETCNETTDTCDAAECSVPADCDDGNACTTDDCVDGTCVNECPGAITAFPYSENFDAGMGAWTNATGDIFDWTRNSGGTASSSTGPSGDHTTGSGYYMYIETSSPRVEGDYAILEGPCLDLTGSSTIDLTFWYHMYGSTIGTLDVEVSDDCTSWTNVWSLSGNQSNAWYQASVNLDAYAGSVIKVRFIGTRGSSYTGDIAIDDIAVDAVGVPCTSDPECDDGDACTVDACVNLVCHNTPISCDDGNECTIDSCVDGVCYNDCAATVDSYPYNEGFESGFGDWTNVGGDDMDWTRNSGTTPSSSTGPSGAHGGTYYIYTEASSPNYPDKTASLVGPCFDLLGASAANLTFWYHMYGSAMGTLYVEVSEDCITWTTVWSLSGNQGTAWYQANVDLTAYVGTTLTIRFRGVTGSSYTSDMSIDDITVDATITGCSVPADCDDGLWCNGAEDCVSGSCVAGTPPDCSDGVACTDDSCNETADSCDHVANDANCDDGLYCNGAETCDALLGCQAGTAVTCDDGVGCTDDSCNESTDSCDYIANDANCPDNGLFCDGTEYCDAVTDCSSTGDPCTGGEVCNEDTDTCDPVSGAKLEAGTLSVGGSVVGVLLDNTYTSPVIVCSVQYNNNTTPVVPRIANVTGTDFDIWLQNPSGGAVATDTVHCLVVEEGVWTVDGVKIEARTYTSTVTDENNSWVGEAQSYGQSYTNPVVIGQVMSAFDSEWSVFWDQGGSRSNPPSSTALRTGKTVCEDVLVSRANETIGFIVFEAGHGTIGGIEYEAALGADSVQGISNAPPYAYTFNTAFGVTPAVAVVTMAGVDGGNGGWAYTYGAFPLSATQLHLAIDEDQIADTERNHVNEQVGYIVFESAFIYP